MKRRASKDKRYSKSVWSQNQKLEAVSTYLMLGSMAETAIITGIPLQTLKVWKTTDWFKEYCLQLKTEDVQQLDSNIQRIVSKSMKALEDRIDLGDSQFDQKTGKIVRVPIKAHVALKITTDLLTKQEKLQTVNEQEDTTKTIDARLIKLAEEFARFASMKVVDIETRVISVTDV